MNRIKFILCLLSATLFALAACDGETPVYTPSQGEDVSVHTQTSQQGSEAPKDDSGEESNADSTVGELPLGSVTVTDLQTGEVIEDTGISVKGDDIAVKVPLTLDIKCLENVAVEFVSKDGDKVASLQTDLTKETAIRITDTKGNVRECTVKYARESFGLPLLEIDTYKGEPIVEKNTYIQGVLKIDGEEYPMSIKGRGNASWNDFPKKSYRIKLDDGAPLFGMVKNRDWVLTSNYADKSLIRNCVAHAVAGSMSGLEYTPTHIPVNLYLNGEYLGVYTFGDKIEDGKGRLDLGEGIYAGNNPKDIGFLLEIGWDFDQENHYNKDYFDTDYVVRIFAKEPEIPVANTPEWWYLKNYVLQMESAIVNRANWEDYIDVDSWIDWFIVTELTFNGESAFYRSCYLWKPAQGKLRLGPVWDFDMAFGNHWGDLYRYDGWCTTESNYTYFPDENWMTFLMKDKRFTSRLVDRWNEAKDELLTTALEAVDKYYAMTEKSADQNFTKWDILDKQIGVGSVNYLEYNTHQKQVDYLRNFIQTRWNYMDERLNSSEYVS